MSSGQIYILELIVKSINLEPGNDILNMDALAVSFKFGHDVNFDIDTENFVSPILGVLGREIKMDYGKSFLFVAKPKALRQSMQSDPFIITLYEGNKSKGSVKVPWKSEFPEMINFFETLGIVKSTTMHDTLTLTSDKNIETGKIDVFLRMSCHGQNVQTMFHIKNDGDKPAYIFRQSGGSSTFQVESFGDEKNRPIIAPLYHTTYVPPSELNIREAVSLTQLFDSDRVMDHKESCFITNTNLEDGGIRLDLRDDFDKLSMCFRPSENKFFDLLHLMTAEVKTADRQTEVTLQKKPVSRASTYSKHVEGESSDRTSTGNQEEFDGIDETTADKIAKRLCGNIDCPAVKKFKEYGIGPLATGKGLGTLYGHVEPPVTYGMSHTYGTMMEYGPYGVFSRPKYEELPFVPRTEDASPILTRPCKIKKDNRNCGQSIKEKKNKKHKTPKWHSQSCPLCPDRLRGGADDAAMLEQQNNPEVIQKSPIIECKSVMDQFDSILAEYKKALGPCGHATCPYAQTIADGTCKKMCDTPLPPAQDGSTLSCNDSADCTVDGCPYAEGSKRKTYPAGCGSPKCAYTKYKLGLVDDDAELELKFLPPALGDNCGDPHCKYPLAPPLQPIHWECPDPLPKGPCRNLNCPFQPPPLKKFKTKKQLKTGPCGSPMCPFALPQPCANPTCPFAMRPCPMIQEQNKKSPQKCPPSNSDKTLCENPDCPFAEKNADKKLSDEMVDPQFKGEFQECMNPQCPNKKKEKKKKSKRKKPKKSACGNPNCPSIQPEKDNKNTCQSSTSESTSVCTDPECPYAGSKKEKKKKQPNVNEGDQSSISSCHKKDEDSLCSNPECPENLAREDPNMCNVPGCPYSKKPPKTTVCDDPTCPYLKPLPSCGIPNCPYEPIPLGFNCKNIKCPSKALNFRKNTGTFGSGGGTLKKVADNVEPGPEVLTTTTVCEDSITCDASDECDNPDCEMKEDDAENKKPIQNSKEPDLSASKKKIKRKHKGKFVYSIGDNYPSSKLGHKDCVTPVFNVPPHMGWLWNIFTPILSMKPRRGWRPGAITNTIASRIRAHRQSKGLGYLKVPPFKKDGTQCDESGDLKVVPKPTLQIQKKEGTYWITMNPLKDPFDLVENEDPYMDCTPMTFKITKNKKPVEDFCDCDDDEHIDNAEVSSSSDSELDIEFTPPAGIIHPERFKKRPNVACCDAQYDPKDFEVPKKKGDEEGKGKGKGQKKPKKGKGGKKK